MEFLSLPQYERGDPEKLRQGLKDLKRRQGKGNGWRLAHHVDGSRNFLVYIYVAWMTSSFDLTERRLIEAQVKAAEEELEQKRKMQREETRSKLEKVASLPSFLFSGLCLLSGKPFSWSSGTQGETILTLQMENTVEINDCYDIWEDLEKLGYAQHVGLSKKELRDLRAGWPWIGNWPWRVGDSDEGINWASAYVNCCNVRSGFIPCITHILHLFIHSFIHSVFLLPTPPPLWY